MDRSFDYSATNSGHILVYPTSLSESLCVSERGGSGEICPFSIRLLFPSLTDGDSSGERDLVLWNAIEYLQVSMSGTANRVKQLVKECKLEKMYPTED